MRSRLRLYALIALALAAAGAFSYRDSTQAQSGGCGLPGPGYCATFDGLPSGPLAYRPPGFDVQVHSRDVNTWQTLETQAAHHGTNCAGYPNVHQTTGQYADAVFLCNDHVMTAINASGYGEIMLTPPAMMDFSSGEAVLRFDVSTLRTSTRDWLDVVISPYADNIALPLIEWLPDLNGLPRNGVHIQMDLSRNSFCPSVLRNGAEQALPCDTFAEYQSWLTPDAVRRDTFELRLSATRLSFGMPAYNRWWTQNATISPALTWTQGVVQLGHHSYTPTKDNSGVANTWHWDNVGIAPAAPLSIVRANERYANAAQPVITFPSPAPAGARLRFAGTAASIDLSYDGGATWTRAAWQPTSQQSGDDFHAQSYFVPVPAGISSVRVRGANTWAGTWIAKDFALWSAGPAPSVTPTPSPSPSPTPTATPSPSPTPSGYPRCRVQRQASVGTAWVTQGTPYPCP